jgi:hypothetical protein
MLRLQLIRGDVHALSIQVQRSGQDWSTATFSAELRRGAGGQLVHTYSVTADTSVAGVATLTLGPVAGTVTADWPSGVRLMGELKVVDPGLGILRLARWQIDCIPPVTA